MENEQIFVEKAAYRLYQLDWLRRHFDSPMTGLIDSMNEYLTDCLTDAGCEPGTSYEEWLEESGFHGNLFVCFEEFLGAEYRDKEYMGELMDSKSVLYQRYLALLDDAE